MLKLLFDTVGFSASCQYRRSFGHGVPRYGEVEKLLARVFGELR
jgi:hypothetical protein